MISDKAETSCECLIIKGDVMPSILMKKDPISNESKYFQCEGQLKKDNIPFPSEKWAESVDWAEIS